MDLNVHKEDNSSQEEFTVIEKTLTIKEAKAQNKSVYIRTVLNNGRGDDAKTIPEKTALKSQVPENQAAIEYKIGIGDSITFTRLIENTDHMKSPINGQKN